MRVYCLHPYTVTNPYTHEKMSVPCGKCKACLNRRANKWSLRIQKEFEVNKYNLFLTLTYDSNIYNPVLSSSDIYNYDVMSQFGFDEEQHSLFLKDYENTNFHAVYGGIPYAPVRHLQLFIKRLRKLLYDNKNIQENEHWLRYYAIRDVGTTTYRFHWHVVLWHCSEFFQNNAEQIIRKAWCVESKSEVAGKPLGNVDIEFPEHPLAVGKYVANYITCLPDLPKVFSYKAFSPKSFFSKKPPIGTSAFTSEQIREVFDHSLTEITLHKPVSHETVSIPLWRTLETQLFEKCVGYCRLPDCGRIALYEFSSLFEDYLSFQQFILRQWSSIRESGLHEDIPETILITALRVALSSVFGDNFPRDITESTFEANITFKSSLLRLWRCSCRFVLFRQRVGFTAIQHYEKIKTYWHRKEYGELKKQLTIEEQVFACPTPSLNPSNLLFFIDPLIIENERNLSSSLVTEYCKQFGLDDNQQLSLDFYQKSDFYKSSKLFFDRYYLDIKNKKLKNEYLDTHPVFNLLHK